MLIFITKTKSFLNSKCYFLINCDFVSSLISHVYFWVTFVSEIDASSSCVMHILAEILLLHLESGYCVFVYAAMECYECYGVNIARQKTLWDFNWILYSCSK